MKAARRLSENSPPKQLLGNLDGLDQIEAEIVDRLRSEVELLEQVSLLSPQGRWKTPEAPALPAGCSMLWHVKAIEATYSDRSWD